MPGVGTVGVAVPGRASGSAHGAGRSACAAIAVGAAVSFAAQRVFVLSGPSARAGPAASAAGPPVAARHGTSEFSSKASVAQLALAPLLLPPSFPGTVKQGSAFRKKHRRPRTALPPAVASREGLVELKEQEPEQAENLNIQPISWLRKPRPPSLPAQLFKPKQSLSQNFLADPNYIYKMVSALDDQQPVGKRVLELGPGTGALTSRLYPRYPEMFGVELDQRAIRQLAINVPGATVIRSDALLVNYTKLAEIRGGPLSIVGNLPFHVVTQIMFTLADHARSVRTVHTTMQKEVAERIVARPNSKKYGILSVAFQLYADVKILFHLPPTAFFPRPNVMSSYISFDFEAAQERREALGVDPRDLRNLTCRAFRMRRKMLHNSLRPLLNCHTTLIDELPEEYATLRPEQIEPWEFVHLTQLIFGKKEFPKHLRRAWRGEFGRTVKAGTP